MQRDREKERNYWLDHFGQYRPGSRRRPEAGPIGPGDYVGIPAPRDTEIPLQEPCLAWRWQLRGGGYGVLRGRGAHVIVFEQTRGRGVREELQVNHLCNRPFCVQPAHLYEGTAQQNSEDRQADLANGRYPRWQIMAHRFDRALTRHHWPVPEPAGISTGWGEPLECPHVRIAGMFDGRGQCNDCGAEQVGETVKAPRECGLAQPCRCGEIGTLAGPAGTMGKGMGGKNLLERPVKLHAI